MKLIIDTDMGIDDAVALLMALFYPDAQLQAITTVVGNVPVAQATHNAGVVLNVANAPATPIYQGCARPLLQYTPQHALDIHGSDGLGGAGHIQPSRPHRPEHAALALVRLARENVGRLTLLTLGPLTNVALAAKLDPHFIKNLHRLVIMGGAVSGRGNTSAVAEFNIAVDPEAAHIVFDACRRAQLSAELISWEATLAHAIAADAWQKIIAGDRPPAQFVQQMSAHIQLVMEAAGYADLLWPDPLAAAVALAPDIVRGHESRFIQVETDQGLARAQTIVDYRSRCEKVPNARIIQHVDMPQFEAMLQTCVGGAA